VIDEETDATPLGTRQLPLNLPELDSVIAHFGLPAPSAISPLTGLLQLPAAGDARPIEDVIAPVADLGPAAMRWALSPLSAPDRIIDAKVSLYEGAPNWIRLYASRRVDGIFAGLRPGTERDYEILAPYSSGDLQLWLRFQMQFAGAQTMLAPAEELSAEQLAFLLVLTDAHKAALFRSFETRRTGPEPVRVSLADVLDAQQQALKTADRRWVTMAVAELLATMVHPGGATGVMLPVVTDEIARAEIKRLATAGLLDGDESAFSLGPVLASFCGSLMSWVCILAMHDLQIVGYQDGQPKAGEELALFFVTEGTVWTVLSDGLTKAAGSLEPVRFGLHSSSPLFACQVAAQFLQPNIGITVPDEVYAPVVAAPSVAEPVPSPAAAPAAPAAEAPAAEAPAAAAPAAAAPAPPPKRVRTPAPWAATHLVPEGGLDAWEKPDPSLQPVAELAEGLEVQVTERTGDWAHIVCDNGWAAWTDGRELVEVKP